jgi:arylsulfatase A-like enzyme
VLTRRTFLSALTAAAATPRKPNIVFILADDLGWRDTSAYGSAFYETPNVERLARRGMQFSQAYAAAPICSPTRASIMTGLYPARLGITVPAGHQPEEILTSTLETRGRPDHKALAARTATRLKLDYFTLAEAFRDAGYATGHFGKWHLGREPYDPLHQGFDVDVPHWWGPGPAGGYLAPWKFPNFQGRPGEHIEDRMAQEAVKFLRANRDKPFFLNYWCFSVHAPHGAKPALIEKYRARADPKAGQRNPVYGAMVQSMDEAVGRLLDALDELRLVQDTIVVFFSDNGGIHFHDIEGAPVTSNAPLRGGKATIYEGGTREPCIVVWPGVVKPASRSDQVISSIDFYPTLLEMTGLRPRDGQKFDGLSIVPALRGGRLSRDAIFCHHPHYTPATGHRPSTYIRQGDWKLIRFYADTDDQKDRFELYNLKDDLGETQDLAPRLPAKVRELNARIDAFLKDTGAVVPQPNPAYNRTL